MALSIHHPLKSYSPLYTAITTGTFAIELCSHLFRFETQASAVLSQLSLGGSWTSSTLGSTRGSFIEVGCEMFVICQSVRYLRAHDRNQVVDAFAKIFFTLSISLASLFFGVHIGAALLPYISKRLKSTLPRPWIVNTLNVLSVMVYLATFPTYFTLSASFRHQATAALLFSFPGTFTRYVLSVTLNPRSTLLPVGTLVANGVGTSLLALFHVLQGLPNPVSPNACSILQGLGDGYCGCLTTVSTFAAEIRALTARKRWFYGTVSIVMGQVLCVLILGSAIWAGNVSARTSCTFFA